MRAAAAAQFTCLILVVALTGASMVIRKLLGQGAFSPEEIAIMVEAYETVRERLHDRGDPELLNEQIAQRILGLAKLGTLDTKEMVSRVLASFEVRPEDKK